MHNKKLADKMGISQANRDAIDHLHVHREALRQELDEVWTKETMELLKLMNYTLQDLWRFDRNIIRHIEDIYYYTKKETLSV